MMTALALFLLLNPVTAMLWFAIKPPFWARWPAGLQTAWFFPPCAVLAAWFVVRERGGA